MLKYSGKLRGWLAENYKKNNELAVFSKVSNQTVSYWCNKNIKPSFEHALAIHDFTNQYITLEDMGY